MPVTDGRDVMVTTLERVMHFRCPAMGRKRPAWQASDRSSYLNDSTRSDNDADGPFPAHPSGGTESAHLRRRDGLKGRQDPIGAVAPSGWADFVPSRGSESA